MLVPPGGFKPLINQPFPRLKKSCFGLESAPIIILSPAPSKHKSLLSLNLLPRNTHIPTPLLTSAPFPQFHSPQSFHSFCVFIFEFVEPRSGKPMILIRRIRLPFSQVWRLEVGNSRCDKVSERVCVCILVPHHPQDRVYTWNLSD